MASIPPPAGLTLPNVPLDHPSMDYAFLRQEGIRHLERMAGALWTDFNTHDPGITILEQLCYAISDLSYRIAYGLPDILSAKGAEPYENLYQALEILPSHPVTPLDLRKLLMDIEGVRNAWVALVDATARAPEGARASSPCCAYVICRS